MKIKYKCYAILLFALLSVCVGSCHYYTVQLTPHSVEDSKLTKHEVPTRIRMSGFHEPEDLTKLCGKKELARVSFFMNVPRYVWCE